MLRMFENPQMSLFGEGRMTPPKPKTKPTPDEVREKLRRVLDTLREAESMPYSEMDAKMWIAIVPNMTKWLPDDEAEEIRAEFTRLMGRFEGVAPSPASTTVEE